ncbi:MAG: T9SS type A sorting domain-containing protein [Bacteroidales bacterium]|nr:T9SS type A sorting domain-containing protein [Bacteroidales bacterium]
MKKFNFFIVLSLFWIVGYIPSKAQQNVPGTPPSFTWNLSITEVPCMFLPKPDLQTIAKEDEEMQIRGRGYRNGVFVDAFINPITTGIWSYLPDGSKIWRIKVSIPDAKALGIYFSNYKLLPGMVFYAYTPDKSFVIGGFTEINNNYDYPVMATQEIPGDEVIIELFVPEGIAHHEYAFEIDKLAYFYRSTPFENSTKVGTCYINVACSEGDNWQNQVRGVAKVTMVLSDGTYLCSGTLINNTNQDCKKYFLMADHCSVSGSGVPVTSAQLLQWTFRFNYQATTCTGTASGPSQVLTGAYYRASDTYGEDNSGSDFFLCELKENLSTTINPYFNGWSISTSPASSGVCIHHPAGVIKKISTYTTPLTTYGNTHWKVYWATTTNGHSVTEGGSSGSPLFNQNKLVVGTLTGGLSACTDGEAGPGTGPNQPDIYGRMDKHFTGIGTSNDKRLKPWLDPTNSNVSTLSGRNLCTTSFNDFLSVLQKINIFPNPASTVLHIDMSSFEMTDINVTISDYTGKVVWNQFYSTISGKLTIPIDELRAGIYFITFEQEGKKFYENFVKL